ncbi:hypothetical protein GBZ48_08320 [Azospirillum melinis]|uniref:HNH endonuclease n=1 Tax=Azospirillum melinis TaxID=328839 RepID=A0ABX2K9D6_9PROT|nr:hypothetical protein [Azospirillum melinis]MBP2308977.1 hypothetical protein [Azospirillum melinis]NUA99292.1 hypothetical protein [Azospirillum melinis]
MLRKEVLAKLRSSKQEPMIDEDTKEEYKKKILDIYKDMKSMAYHTKGVPLGKLSDSPKLSLRPVTATSLVGKKLQSAGQKHGCWTCGKKMGADGAAGWVADHIPPYSLNMKRKVFKEFESKHNVFSSLPKWKLLPSCVDCCRKQSSVVAKLNKTKSLEDFEKEYNKNGDYLTGGPHYNPNHAVPTSSKRTDHARAKWIGETLHCHICGSKSTTSANTRYTADHLPPREFNTPYVIRLLLFAGIADREFKIMPQCVKCSGKQANFKSLAKKLRAIGAELGFKTAKGM